MRSLNDFPIYFEIDDVSTAGQVTLPAPDDGEIVEIYTALNGAIATADAVLTPKINGTAMTGGAITIAQSGSAAGDIDSAVPTANNAVVKGDRIEIESNGASTNAVKVAGWLILRR